MVDIVKGVDYFLNASTGVFKDNTTGDIDADDLRNFVRSVFRPEMYHGHRLTLEQGVSVSTSDQTGKTTIYLMPHLHKLCGLHDGTDWILCPVPEIAISLGTLTNALPYDVFAFTSTAVPSSTNTGTDILTFGSATGWATGSLVTVDATGGGLTANTEYFYNAASSTTGSLHTTLANALAGTSKVDLTATITATLRGVSMEMLAWTNGTTRATALTTQDGVYVKSGATTRLYLGTFYTTATTTTEDSANKRFLWNNYNRVSRTTLVSDSTDSWTYSSATIRQARGSSANQIELVCGITGRSLSLKTQHLCGRSVDGEATRTGIGENSTSAYATNCFMDQFQVYSASSTGTTAITASFVGPPRTGYSYFAWLEQGHGSGTQTWYGDAGVPTLVKCGMIGEWQC